MAKKDGFKIESTNWVNNFNDYKLHKNLILNLLKTRNSFHVNN